MVCCGQLYVKKNIKKCGPSKIYIYTLRLYLCVETYFTWAFTVIIYQFWLAYIFLLLLNSNHYIHLEAYEHLFTCDAVNNQTRNLFLLHKLLFVCVMSADIVIYFKKYYSTSLLVMCIVIKMATQTNSNEQLSPELCILD